MMRRAFRLSALAVLLLGLAWATPALAVESVAYRFVLDIELGTSVTEGVARVIGNRFAISQITWFRSRCRHKMQGRLFSSTGNRSWAKGARDFSNILRALR